MSTTDSDTARTAVTNEAMRLTPDKPVLITTVDTEESFDWGHSFSRSAINVSAMSHQHRAHDIFSRYGVVPNYLVDYPVANQAYGSEPLRELMASGLCKIGTQLHPWVNPPFNEFISVRNSYPGNLGPTLEREKLKILTALIEDVFGVKPRIYRAGRYGFGRHTTGLLKEFGYCVDTSMVPGWSFAAEGGPDYRSVTSEPFWLDPEQTLLEIPVSAALVGRAAQFNPALFRHLFDGISERFRLPAIMARLNLLERIKLTPEGMTIDEAKRLVRQMVMRGRKVFMLTYHSPSLEPGNTPYVKTPDDLRRFLAWLDEFYDFFISEIGGHSTTWEDVHALASAQANSSKEASGSVALNFDAQRVARIGLVDEPIPYRSPPSARDNRARDPKGMASSKDALLIAYYYPPENAIGGARSYRMAHYLMQEGHPVTVIAANPPGLPASPEEVVRVSDTDKSGRKVRIGSALGWVIERFVMPYSDRLSWVAPAFARAVTLMGERPYRTVLSSHPPAATHLVALMLKWRYGVSWIADFRDPLWGNAYRTARRAAVLDPLLERMIFRNADVVIANTDSVAELWSKRYPRWSHKIHLIWNGFDPEDEFAPIPTSGRARRTIVHTGTLYGPRTPELLLQSLDRLSTDPVKIAPEAFQIRMIGPVENGSLDPSRPHVHRLTASDSLYVERRMIPKERARQEMLEADYLLLLDMTTGDYAGMQLPAKIFDYIRACRPIIAFTQKGSVTERMLARARCRYLCVDPLASAQEIDAQLASFLNAPLGDTKPSPEFWQDFDARNQMVDLKEIILRLSSTEASPGDH